MKRKQLILTLLALFVCNATYAYDDGEVFTATTPEGIEMTFKVLSAADMTVQVGDGSNPAIDQSFDGDLVIPSEINGLNVTEVGCRAFYNCQNLQSVTIEEGIMTLGTSGDVNNETYGPFYRAKIVGSVIIPSTLTFIGMNTFYLAQIGEITLPPTLEDIWLCAFYSAQIGTLNIPYGETALHYVYQKVSGENWTAFNWTQIGKLSLNRALERRGPIDYSTPFYGVTIGEFYVGQHGEFGLQRCTVENYYPKIAEMFDGNEFDSRSGCKNLYLPEGYTTITSVPLEYPAQSISIPSTVTSIAEGAFPNTPSYVTVNIEVPIDISEKSFPSDRTNATLYVPYGSRDAYRNKDYWKDFCEIIEINTVNVGSSGFATYCSPNALDFSGITDVRAYVCSDYDSETNTLMMTRVTEVPAGEGLYIVGNEGSYEIPETTTDAVYSNLLIGVARATYIEPTEGSKTNLILADGIHGIGFYTLSQYGWLAGGKAYLQLPTESVSGVKAINLVFDDDATGIASPKFSHEGKDVIYNLAGQHVNKAQKGLYIIKGKEVINK